MAVRGIDVSVHNGNIDYTKVKAAGYSFVMIRAGFGKYTDQKDGRFEQNYRNAKAAGLNVGAYWYSYAKNSAEAKLEAECFLQAIKGKTFEYPLAYDVEDRSQSSLASATIASICKTFMDVLESHKCYVSIYSMVSWLGTKIPTAICQKYDVWCAHFTTAIKPSYSGSYGIWQHSSTGRINGCNGNVDCNISYKDYAGIMKDNGFNGFNSPLTRKYKTVKATHFRHSPSFSSPAVNVLKKGRRINVVNGWAKVADGVKWSKVLINKKYYYLPTAHIQKI